MKYSKETKQMIDKVENAIKSSTGGDIPQEYEPQLQLLADNFENYLLCRDAIKREGIVAHTKSGEVKMNPIYNAMLNTESFIQKILNQFGLTVMTKSKLKVNMTQTNDDEDDYLKNMLA